MCFILFFFFLSQHLFAQNKEKLIHAALTAILNRDVGDIDKMPVEELEQVCRMNLKRQY